ncbi:hypothetical protein CHLNCDRAFT_143807 [Chlorella variabilis]|uniref:Adenine DNA glycosylase n=1 Tax=Chlorella variabilis TaxID=554065 RepID=E1ZAH3_CHLVA|nr:hypothetical protein CHLNCDRAFT_143807 [Chlorella variabilis]EFN57259.1 hypothetical protein CHLNCDRAFT_143807 [Chlorella variabilis]|eukprot:XP_005849361.1 hypothetical protein CHLNCDRAFT_143807 [Chlorella variabilis]
MAPKRAREASQGVGRAKSSRGASKAAGSVEDIEDIKFTLAEIRSSLLAWYDENHRVLPWRRNPHSKLSAEAVAAAAAAGQEGAPLDLPRNEFVYYVWICEVMSQQASRAGSSTQVSRAAEYFRRWVARWPTVQALAGASQEEVNELWAGLGYYRRARYLLDGAKYIVGQLDGSFPTTAAELQAIPGVVTPAVMELGATVCVPNTDPKCGECPVSASCAALRAVRRHEEAGGRAGEAGAPRVTDYPAKVEKAEKREEAVAVAVVQLLPAGVAPSAAAAPPHRAASRFLLVQRPATGLLAGLWQFPLLPLGPEAEGSPRRQHQLMDAYLEAQLGVQLQQQGAASGQARGGGGGGAGGGVRVVGRHPLGQVVHVFSHIRMTMKVEAVVLQGDLDTSARGADEAADLAALQWVPGGEMGGKGLSSGVKKVYKLFTDACSKAASKQSITAFFRPKAPAAAAADGAASA